MLEPYPGFAGVYIDAAHNDEHEPQRKFRIAMNSSSAQKQAIGKYSCPIAAAMAYDHQLRPLSCAWEKRYNFPKVGECNVRGRRHKEFMPATLPVGTVCICLHLPRQEHDIHCRFNQRLVVVVPRDPSVPATMNMNGNVVMLLHVEETERRQWLVPPKYMYPLPKAAASKYLKQWRAESC